VLRSIHFPSKRKLVRCTCDTRISDFLKYIKTFFKFSYFERCHKNRIDYLIHFYPNSFNSLCFVLHPCEASTRSRCRLRSTQLQNNTVDVGISPTYGSSVLVGQLVDIIYGFTCPIFVCSSAVCQVNKLFFIVFSICVRCVAA
jgi:hypothetical protein